AGQHEARAQRRGSDDRHLALEHAADVGRLADARSQVLDRGRETLALRLDVLADVLRRSAVTRGHRSSAPPTSASPPLGLAPAEAGWPSLSTGRQTSRARRRAGPRRQARTATGPTSRASSRIRPPRPPGPSPAAER